MVATDPCGVITDEYLFDGEQLTVDMVDDQCGSGGEPSDELIAQTALYETAPFMLERRPVREHRGEPGGYVSTSSRSRSRSRCRLGCTGTRRASCPTS